MKEDRESSRKSDELVPDKHTGQNIRAGCAAEPAYACVCLAAAIAGSFVCGVRYIPVWILLVFHSYTDIKTRQIYCLPTRIYIAVDIILYLLKGAAYGEYIITAVCVAAVILMSSVLHMYAQGDAEVFIMIIAAFAVRGQTAAGYTVNIVWLSGIMFCVMIFVKNFICNLHCFSGSREVKLIRTGPMVPAITIAFMISCLQWKISFTAMS